MQQVGKFRELYFNEQKQRLNFETELRDCKVCIRRKSVSTQLLTVSSIFHDQCYVQHDFQINLENSNKVLQEVQENHRKAISMLKEKEFIISKLLHSGKTEKL